MDHKMLLFRNSLFVFCLSDLLVPPSSRFPPAQMWQQDYTCAMIFIAHVELPIGIVHCTHICLPVCTLMQRAFLHCFKNGIIKYALFWIWSLWLHNCSYTCKVIKYSSNSSFSMVVVWMNQNLSEYAFVNKHLFPFLPFANMNYAAINAYVFAI